MSLATRFVLSLENDLTVRAKTTEINVKDFSSGSYGTIFGNEVQIISIIHRANLMLEVVELVTLSSAVVSMHLLVWGTSLLFL